MDSESAQDIQRSMLHTMRLEYELNTLKTMLFTHLMEQTGESFKKLENRHKSMTRNGMIALLPSIRKTFDLLDEAEINRLLDL